MTMAPLWQVLLGLAFVIAMLMSSAKVGAVAPAVAVGVLGRAGLGALARGAGAAGARGAGSVGATGAARVRGAGSVGQATTGGRLRSLATELGAEMAVEVALMGLLSGQHDAADVDYSPDSSSPAERINDFVTPPPLRRMLTPSGDLREWAKAKIRDDDDDTSDWQVSEAVKKSIRKSAAAREAFRDELKSSAWEDE